MLDRASTLRDIQIQPQTPAPSIERRDTEDPTLHLEADSVRERELREVERRRQLRELPAPVDGGQGIHGAGQEDRPVQPESFLTTHLGQDRFARVEREALCPDAHAELSARVESENGHRIRRHGRRAADQDQSIALQTIFW